MKSWLVLAACWLAACAIVPAAAEPIPIATRNIVIYEEPGRFAGWPANHGAWSWGNELLIGFEIGQFRNTDRGHAIDYTKPSQHVLARSLDGGETWAIERPESLRPPTGARIAGVPVEAGGRQPVPCPGGIEFTRPGFLMTWRMAGIHVGPSRFYYSYDRGKTWQGPFIAPDFGTKGVAARTDYIVYGRNDAMVFLTAAKSNGREGRVFCARTKDGGANWNFVSYIGPEVEDYAIMPSSLQIGPKSILTSLRRTRWIETWRSDDEGHSWQFLNRTIPETGGNPPSLFRLKDGRLALTYGYRKPPFSIRARISSDNGATWSCDLILRQDGGSFDLGYTRSLVRPDGKVVTAYYFNTAKDKERFIGASIWEPPTGLPKSTCEAAP